MSQIQIKRQRLRFDPDPSRVIAKFYLPGGEKRAQRIIDRVFSLSDEECLQTLQNVFEDFSDRHSDLEAVLLRNYQRVQHLIKEPEDLSHDRRLLLGSFFSLEYSIESAAMFNPSIVIHLDQSDLQEESARYILSFRAIGEGHISSIVFRTGIIDRNNHFITDPVGPLLERPVIEMNHTYDKNAFIAKALEINVSEEVCGLVFDNLPHRFLFNELQESINKAEEKYADSREFLEMIEDIYWIAQSNYEETFVGEGSLSERIIFPVAQSEKNGIEDARFVRFVDDDGDVTYYATYTAYSGNNILPMLMETKDFLKFKMLTLNGEVAKDKGIALFPRKIRGKYVMINRMDGENLYIASSDNIYSWYEIHKLQEPQQSWEFVQIGNCGSPIETKDGWLLLTHGVGPFRKYCIGVELLDLNNPSKIIGKLEHPLIMPNEYEREGYVPNVTYSCGAIIHNDILVIPYGLSDTSSSIATTRLKPLIDKLLGR
ncbi:glycoside hydrolase family 130 protein [Thermodesulfobacteriota bacterium]